MTVKFLLHLILEYLLGPWKSSREDFELDTQTHEQHARLPHAVPRGVIAIKNGDVREIEVVVD